MHYFTADTHLGHKNVLRHDGRPWDDVDKHDKDITANMVPEPRHRNISNELWFLGDVAWKASQVEELIAAIRPHWFKIHLIRGNHDDRAAWKMRHLFDSANEALYVRVDADTRLYLSHYAHRVWRNSHHGSIHIHGHSHGALPPWGKSIDAGCMLHEFRPLPLDRIIKKVEGTLSINHH